MAEDMKESAKKIAVIPHGPLMFSLDMQALRKRTREIRDMIPGGRGDSKNEKPVISFLGYLRSYKGLDIFAEVAGRKEIQERAGILVAGDGEASGLEEIRKNSEVLLINRRLDNQEFLACLHASDIVVLPYRKISQSGLLLTTIAEGIPVVVSNVGGMPDLVAETESGWILDTLSADSLESMLCGILDEVLSSDNHRSSGISNEENRAEWREIAESTRNLYINSTVYS